MGGLVAALGEKPGFVHMAPASDASISEAERRMRAKLSDEFRAYASAYGCASWEGHELTGVCGHERLDVAAVTLEERALNPKVPSGLYVVEQAHIDGIVVWQDEAGRVYYSQPSRPPARAFDSLLEYVSQ